MNKLARLAELAKQLPDDLVADWLGTNHFEIHSGRDAEYFWLDVQWAADLALTDAERERIGLVLDIAAEVSRLKREGVFASQAFTEAKE